MEHRVSATEARVHFGALMRRVVERGEPVIVEHSGEPRVVVMSVHWYKRLLAAQRDEPDWRDLVRRAREQVEADLAGRELTPPEDILRASREERDARLVALR